MINVRRPAWFLVLLGLCAAAAGCASSYVTPGGPARLDAINNPDIAAVADRKPAASFPAEVAVVRVQAPDYRSESRIPSISGRYSVITTDTLLTDQDRAAIGGWPEVAGVAPIGSLLLPPTVNSLEDLRVSAARLQADIMLVYTLDTTFHIRETGYARLAFISLGLAPDRNAYVDSTASALFVDVRTGYVYGQAEGSARAHGLTNAWGSAATVERKRVTNEEAAFTEMLSQAATTWQGIVERYGD